MWRHSSRSRREGPGVQSGLLSPEGQGDQFPNFPAGGLLLFPSFLVKSIVISSFYVIETEAQGSEGLAPSYRVPLWHSLDRDGSLCQGLSSRDAGES